MKIFAFSVLAGSLAASAACAGMADQQVSSVEPPQGKLPSLEVGEKAPHRYLFDPALYIQGEWIVPGADVIRGYYPVKALEDEVDGKSMVDCRVAEDGAVSECVPAFESPRGYGFGAATVKLVREHVRVEPTSVLGGIKPGARMEFTYDWTFESR